MTMLIFAILLTFSPSRPCYGQGGVVGSTISNTFTFRTNIIFNNLPINLETNIFIPITGVKINDCALVGIAPTAVTTASTGHVDYLCIATNNGVFIRAVNLTGIAVNLGTNVFRCVIFGF